MAAERPLYEQILRDIKASVSDNEYQSSIVMETEQEFWNNIVDISLMTKAKYHDQLPDVLWGVSVEEWKEVLDMIVPTARKLTWPVETYVVAEDAERLLKLPVIIAIIHGVYNLGRRGTPETVIVRNPEKPYAYIRMNTELVEQGKTTKIPEDYARIMYGYETPPGSSKKYIHFLRREDMGIPPGRGPVELGREPMIRDATQIPAFAALRNIEV